MELFVCVPVSGKGECKIFPNGSALADFMLAYPAGVWDVKTIKAEDLHG